MRKSHWRINVRGARRARVGGTMGVELEDAVSSGATQALESVTADARRRALEAFSFGPQPRHRELELLVLGPLGIALIDPVGQRFDGEAEALARIATAESRERDSATQRLSDAAIDVWRHAREGTAASRTALLRAVLAFLLHHVASQVALQSSEEASA
jgi:hypothetical protein